jgi:hypothetical protein
VLCAQQPQTHVSRFNAAKILSAFFGSSFWLVPGINKLTFSFHGSSCCLLFSTVRQRWQSDQFRCTRVWRLGSGSRFASSTCAISAAPVDTHPAWPVVPHPQESIAIKSSLLPVMLLVIFLNLHLFQPISMKCCQVSIYQLFSLP